MTAPYVTRLDDGTLHINWPDPRPATFPMDSGLFEKLIAQANQAILDDDDPPGGPFPSRTERVTAWWVEQAKVEADKLAPKAIEYGSYDLEVTGQLLAEMTNTSHAPLADTKAQLMEQGIVFYLVGKIARVASAMRDGHPPSDDTYRDIAIYARMVLYIREHGTWP